VKYDVPITSHPAEVQPGKVRRGHDGGSRRAKTGLHWLKPVHSKRR